MKAYLDLKEKSLIFPYFSNIFLKSESLVFLEIFPIYTYGFFEDILFLKYLKLQLLNSKELKLRMIVS